MPTDTLIETITQLVLCVMLKLILTRTWREEVFRKKKTKTVFFFLTSADFIFGMLIQIANILKNKKI